MNFEGTYEIKAPREKVWEFITDPNRIGKCLPDVRNLELAGEDRFTAIVKVGIGVIKGDFNFRLAIEKTPPSHVKLKATGTGAGSNVDLDTNIDLEEVAGGTRIAYKTNVKVGGVMAGLGQRMMGKVAEKTISQVFECVSHELETP